MHDNTARDKYIVLPSFSCIHVKLGFARPEIAGFYTQAESAADPHV